VHLMPIWPCQPGNAGQVSTERDVSRTDTLLVSRASGIPNHKVRRSCSLLKGTAGMQLLCSSKVVAKTKPQGATSLLGLFRSNVTLIMII
jgi:hypothetical protein